MVDMRVLVDGPESERMILWMGICGGFASEHALMITVCAQVQGTNSQQQALTSVAAAVVAVVYF